MSMYLKKHSESPKFGSVPTSAKPMGNNLCKRCLVRSTLAWYKQRITVGDSRLHSIASCAVLWPS